MPKLSASVFPKDYSVLFQSYKHDLNSHVSLVLLEVRFSVSIFVGSWRKGCEAAANLHCSCSSRQGNPQAGAVSVSCLRSQVSLSPSECACPVPEQRFLTLLPERSEAREGHCSAFMLQGFANN